MNKFLSFNFVLGFFVIAVALTLINFSSANAATLTASVSGNWSDTATWGGISVPTSTDDVVIADGVVVVVDTAAQAQSIVLNAPTTTNGITISGTNSLAVSGAITMNSPTAVADQTINVGDGVLAAGSITMPGSATTGQNTVLLINNGTATFNGNVTPSGSASQSKVTFTGSGNLQIGGNYTIGGTFTAGTGTVTMTGSSTITLTKRTYNNLVINLFPGSTLNFNAGAMTMNGNLTVKEGNVFFPLGTLTILGTTTIEGGGTITQNSTSGVRTFTGNVSIETGGVWTESSSGPIVFGNGLENDGTMNASTATHTFTGTGVSISGGNTISIPNVTINGTVSNAGTLTIATALSGTGTLTNQSGATLSLGGTVSIAGLDTTAMGNTVRYSSGGQTIKPVSYDLLDITGTGSDTVGSGITIANDLTLGPGINLSLTGNSNAFSLGLNGVFQQAGVWGSTSSTATNTDDTYFSGTGTLNVAHAYSSSNPPDITPPDRYEGTPTDTLDEGTTSVSLGMRTDETAICRYSTVSNMAYDDMTMDLLDSRGNFHYADLENLTPGTYRYYVRCKDTEGNANTSDYEISFTISAAVDQTSSRSGNRSGSIPTTQQQSGGSSCPLGQVRNSLSGFCEVPVAITPITFQFTENLFFGKQHTQVKQLQHFLNTHGFLIAVSGAGSPGNETEYFGVRTRTALQKFQAQYHVTPTKGYFGSITRTLINSML